MADLAHDGEGTNTASVTVGGKPNGFDGATSGGVGTTFTYDNAHVHTGVTSIKTHLATVASTSYTTWSTAISPTPTANAYSRFYFYSVAAPSVACRIAAFYTGANPSGVVQYLATGALRILNSALATVVTTTATVPLNQWVRIEYDLTGIVTTAGNPALRMFSGANLEGSTPDTNGSVSATGATTLGTVDSVRFGVSSAVTQTVALDLWMDDYAFSQIASPGALRYPVSRYWPPTPVMRAAGW